MGDIEFNLKLQLDLEYGLHKDCMNTYKKEFQIYREREMKELQSDFDMLMKSLTNKEGENNGK